MRKENGEANRIEIDTLNSSAENFTICIQKEERKIQF